MRRATSWLIVDLDDSPNGSKLLARRLQLSVRGELALGVEKAMELDEALGFFDPALGAPERPVTAFGRPLLLSPSLLSGAPRGVRPICPVLRQK